MRKPMESENIFPVSDSALVRWWRETKCRCGREKESRKFFCPTCYYSLPEKMRGNFFGLTLADPDFFSAFRDALVWLNAIGRIRKVAG